MPTDVEYLLFSASPLSLVRHLNRKLASAGKVITKTQRKAARARGAYQLLDVGSGEVRYLSLDELKSVVRELIGDGSK